MIYLYWYLGIGLAVCAVVFCVGRLTKNHRPKSPRDLLDAPDPDRKMLAHRIVNGAALLALGVAIWPAVQYFAGLEAFGNERDWTLDEEPEFGVESGHMQERLTAHQIEAREMVADPFGAVPSVPFGHLNSAWKTFVGTVAESDEIWSFSAPWQTRRGPKEIRAGYVIVHDGAPAAHLLTMWKRLEEYQAAQEQQDERLLF